MALLYRAVTLCHVMLHVCCAKRCCAVLNGAVLCCDCGCGCGCGCGRAVPCRPFLCYVIVGYGIF